jgi:hypothetical protein
VAGAGAGRAHQACCALTMPTPTVRSFQMRLLDSSSSISSRRDENCGAGQAGVCVCV